jgi:chromosome partitioning protein
LRLKGVIATRYSGRKKMHRHVLEQIQASLGEIDVFTVRDCIAVAESPVAGRSVLDYKPQSTGAQDYYSIARGLIHGKQ